MTFTLIGVRADGTSETIAEHLHSYTEAERVRRGISDKPNRGGFKMVIIRSEAISSKEVQTPLM